MSSKENSYRSKPSTQSGLLDESTSNQAITTKDYPDPGPNHPSAASVARTVKLGVPLEVMIHQGGDA